MSDAVVIFATPQTWTKRRPIILLGRTGRLQIVDLVEIPLHTGTHFNRRQTPLGDSEWRRILGTSVEIATVNGSLKVHVWLENAPLPEIRSGPVRRLSQSAVALQVGFGAPEPMRPFRSRPGCVLVDLGLDTPTRIA